MIVCLWQLSGDMTTAEVTSCGIEEKFLESPGGDMPFKTGNNNYILDFSSLVQLNVKTGMERKVRRRPVARKDTSDITATAAPDKSGKSKKRYF